MKIGKVYKKVKHIFHIYDLSEVFTPNTAADIAYVRRNNLEESLENRLSECGKCIIVYGESGSGKTTLMRTRLKELRINFVSISCTHETTYDSILRSAIDELDVFYIAKKTTNKKYSISSSVAKEFFNTRLGLNASTESSHNVEQNRAVPLQITAQRLAKFLGEVNSILILEDFHKVSDVEKIRIADLIKVFMDEANNYPDLKVVCIGAVESPRELIRKEADLHNRVSELEIPMLSDKELKTLISIGSSALNISMSEALIEKIVHYSNNIASLAHQMCRDICFYNQIKKTRLRNITIDDDKFSIVIDSFIKANSDSLKCIYDLCTKQKIGWYVLRTMLSFSKPASLNEVFDKLAKAHHYYNVNEIQAALDEMASDRMKILQFSFKIEKYSISTPFWRAFLNMQLSKEKSEKEKLNKAKKNPRLRVKNIHEVDKEVEFAFYHYLEDQTVKK